MCFAPTRNSKLETAFQSLVLKDYLLTPRGVRQENKTAQAKSHLPGPKTTFTGRSLFRLARQGPAEPAHHRAIVKLALDGEAFAPLVEPKDFVGQVQQ